jgi:hypothetical protein
LPPRAKSVPLLSKSLCMEPLSPTNKTSRKSSGVSECLIVFMRPNFTENVCL